MTSDDGRKRKRPSAVVFYTYPKLIFAWPLILAGFVLYPVAAVSWIDQEVLAWIWALTAVVTVLTIGVDIARNAAAFWVVAIAAIWLLGLWLRDAKGITVFGDVFRFFANLDPSYPRTLALSISLWLTIPYVAMYLWSRINDKWRFTHNEFEHRSLGKVDWSAARAAKTVRSSYPDLFEALLCLAGDLIIYDARGARVIRRIPHVPLLPLVRRRIDVILETTSVTAAQIEEEEMDDEEAGGDADQANGDEDVPPVA